jgi:hypothetical protein
MPTDRGRLHAVSCEKRCAIKSRDSAGESKTWRDKTVDKMKKLRHW